MCTFLVAKHGEFILPYLLQCIYYLLLTFYLVSTMPELKVAGRLPLWLIVVAEIDSFSGNHLNLVYYACFLVICSYNLALLHICSS